MHKKVSASQTRGKKKRCGNTDELRESTRGQWVFLLQRCTWGIVVLGSRFEVGRRKTVFIILKSHGAQEALFYRQIAQGAVHKSTGKGEERSLAKEKKFPALGSLSWARGFGGKIVSCPWALKADNKINDRQHNARDKGVGSATSHA